MSIIARDTSEARHVPAAGLRNAVCVDVVDFGLVETTWDGKTRTQHKVSIIWELDADHPHFNEPERVNRRYTLSLNERASLCQDLESWRGQAFSEDEKAGFDVERLIGVRATLNVVHNPAGDRTYANVKAVLPHQPHAPELAPSAGYVRVKDRVGGYDVRSPQEGPQQGAQGGVPTGHVPAGHRPTGHVPAAQRNAAGLVVEADGSVTDPDLPF